MISAADVTFAYDGTPVLAGVGLEARSGIVGLIGPNGSGKTTLLRILYAALAPRGGTVLVDDRPVTSVPHRELPRRIAVVAQEAPPELPVTVADMVLLGRAPHRSSLQAYTAEDHRIAAAALRRVGMRDLADRNVATLSGGEKQRTLIARALAQQAHHLLLDEPTNHLDIHYQHEILHLVRSLDVTTVVVLHDLNLAGRYCDHLVLLDQGTVACAGPTADVLTPEVLEPVYRVSVRTLHDEDCVQLVFRPQAPATATLLEDGQR
ncbi:ABC transporter ATP-binding protein [Streptomyces litchfieldiae]|uniref:ABC transporter ATP-binding protein n=1 Tax=Streptomyces litchfieldiae TaxID=3075543 RepID=A0ABU2MW36_9ACTN|nr:ABC transporter ATP-binding protein [Streptomyces sp. DSM 44938]MDT0345715.1 ABC transporter ATP-binding protein [Streptomyces sp. DSM 44938]